MEKYETIFKNHDGLIAHKWVHYFYIYDLLFENIIRKNKPINILEIGVDRGGGLEIWKKYFPENSKIHGIDINKRCEKIKFSDNIFFHLGDATDRVFMERIFSNIEFDIILDDGSHICSDVIETFKIMFPKLKAGGLYVVEDLCTSYWKDYDGGYRKKGTSIEYFKNLIEAINSDYIVHFNFLRKYLKYFSKGFKDKVKIFLKNNGSRILSKKAIKTNISNGIDYSKLIESISFYDSICAIKKFQQQKNNPFKSVITGQKNIDGLSCFKNEVPFIQDVKKYFGE